MKRTTAGILLATLAFTLTACGSTATTASSAASTEAPAESVAVAPSEAPAEGAAETQAEAPSEATEQGGGNILVAYFSRTGENYGVGVIEKGNTHIIGEMIAEELGADEFYIQTVTPYPESYDETVDIAQTEQRENARPELTASVENMDDYDVIFLGYPNWWGDMPMAVYTFLESYDFSGKTIVPFATHAGSGLSGTAASIAAACPGATVLDGLAVSGTTAQNNPDEARAAVTDWLAGLDLS